MSAPGRITDVAGITVGCWTDARALTGCTVVLCPEGAVVGAEVRGGAPGTRDTELARPGMLVERANAVLLTGGSAFGLDAAGGVMRWLEERGKGFRIAGGVVPIVPAAVVFDLGLGDPGVRPDREAGYLACAAAGADVPEGSVGAGTGCTVGKRFGPGAALRGGQGTAALRVAGRFTVGALVVVNAAGDVVDPSTGRPVAGARPPAGASSEVSANPGLGAGGPLAGGSELNTTIGVVATDAPLRKEMVQRVAWMAHDGLARAIRPSHTLFDGDTIFVLATAPPAQPALTDPLLISLIGAAAAEAVGEAIVRAVRAATPPAGIPAASVGAPRPAQGAQLPSSWAPSSPS
ncbi:MAG TPA: P1 family peptidase [Chloroflexota bacterium]|nr:P1 family peptidase [Chloroflexota bacterium]